MQGTGNGLRAVIAQRGFDGDVRARGVGQGQLGIHVGVLDGHAAGHGEEDVVPDAGVAASDGGDPVPTDGGVERGVVGAQRAAVFIGALEVLFFDAAGSGVLQDAHGEGALAAGRKFAGDIETRAGEGAFHAAEFLAVEVDIGLPVDAGEIQPHLLPGAGRGRRELVAIPEIGVEERVGDHGLVVAEIGIGDRAGIVVAGEHGARHGGHQPVAVGKTGLREGDAGGLHLRIALHLPGAAGEGESRGRGLGVDGESAASPDFELAEGVAFGRGGFCHEHAHIAGGGGLSELDVGGVERVHGCPILGIVGDLKGALRRSADPG